MSDVTRESLVPIGVRMKINNLGIPHMVHTMIVCCLEKWDKPNKANYPVSFGRISMAIRSVLTVTLWSEKEQCLSQIFLGNEAKCVFWS